MKEQDRRAVEGMARCGIDLDGLISMFPKFQAEEIEKIYKEVNDIISGDNTVVTISRNCS